MSFTALQLVNELLSRFERKEVASLGETPDSTLALRKINLAQQIISTAHPFVFAEKNTPGSITAVEGTSIYTLATDVAHVIAAKHTYNGGGWIKPIDRAALEQYRADRSQTADRGTPQFLVTAGALQAAAANTPALRAELWRVPDANFAGQVISYYYTFILSDLTAATDLSLIPGDFHWLILEVAETLYRRGRIRAGGADQVNQIDLFTIADNKAQAGIKDLISRYSAIQGAEFAWQNDEPSL